MILDRLKQICANNKANRAPPDVQEISINVDRQWVRCPNLITGGDLYHLAQVRWGYDLWRVSPLADDDERISNNGTEFSLFDGEHFYTSPW